MELCPCLTVKENCIANAEYVIEGGIQPRVKVVEDQNSHTGFAMPEFPGYNGAASHECWLIKVKAVTHREHPIMQTCIGPSAEHVDIFDTDDVLWAMNTRFQGDRDVITIPGVRCHPLDPSSCPEYSPSISDRGISCRTIFDCTVPFHLILDSYKK